MVKKVVLWFAVIACMVTIFMFSAQSSDTSNELSEGFLYRVLDFFNYWEKMPRAMQFEQLEKLHVIIRKIAHFSIYAILGFWACLLVKVGYEIKGFKGFWMPAVFCVLYAVTDEIHQVFVPGRSGQGLDVLIDSIGGTVGVGIAVIICLIFIRRKKNG